MTVAELQFALGSQIAQIFRREIVSGALKPGQRLIEHELSERFGVSRGPARDALRVLATEGLVEIKKGKASVIGLTDHDVNELYSLRRVLELFAYDLVFPRRDDLDWSPFDRALDAMGAAEEADDPSAFAAADLRFHQALFSAADHRRLQSIWGQMAPTLEVLLEFNAEHRPLRSTRKLHDELLETMRTADHDTAREAIEDHLESARTRINASRPGE